MKEVNENEFEIDFDFEFEFDVAKFYDLTQVETYDEIIKDELWFELAQGHDPSPLLAKLENEEDDFSDSVSSSPRYGAYSEYLMDDDDCAESHSQVFLVQDKRESQMQMEKSKPTTQTSCPANSRLLQPTTSLLAKKNQGSSVRSSIVSSSHQKLGYPPKSFGEFDDTKRQKLEIGYLHKVGTSDANSRVKPKPTIPKEPNLATSHRRVKQMSKNATYQGNDKSYGGSSFKAKPLNKKILETQTSFPMKKKSKAPLPQFQDGSVRVGKIVDDSAAYDYRRLNPNNVLQQEKSDKSYNFRDCQLNKKIVSAKGDIGVLQSCMRETSVPREFKLETSKKMSQTPPTELFSKISLNPKIHLNSLVEEQTTQVKVLEKNASIESMKENKNPNAIMRNSMRCSGYESRMIADIVDHLMSYRSFTKY